MELQTARLVLRPFRASDVPAFYDYIPPPKCYDTTQRVLSCRSKRRKSSTTGSPRRNAPCQTIYPPALHFPAETTCNSLATAVYSATATIPTRRNLPTILSPAAGIKAMRPRWRANCFDTVSTRSTSAVSMDSVCPKISLPDVLWKRPACSLKNP